ncbi:MAG: hypothetical protein ABIQ92_03050 [Ornithinibacter sp.]
MMRSPWVGSPVAPRAGDRSVRWEDPPGFWSEIGRHQLKYFRLG